jgi:hypothetical protein
MHTEASQVLALVLRGMHASPEADGHIDIYGCTD